MVRRYVLFGPPGVGKGTQAALFCGETGCLHLSSGDIFRSEIGASTELGKLAKSHMDKGELVPDDVTIRMMVSRLCSAEASERGFLLDGFPRTVAQAKALDEALEVEGVTLDGIIVFQAPDDVVVERMLGRGRSDDTEQTIRHRLGIYHDQTCPVVGYYEAHMTVHEIDATQSVEDVFEALKAATAL